MDFSQYQLAPEYIRREAEPGYDAQIWSPDWKCYACHDTGKVIYSLVRRIIPDYDADRCKQILCKNPSCRAGKEISTHPIMADQLDTRFSVELCAQLHRFEYDGWHKKPTTEQQEQEEEYKREIAEQTKKLVQKKSMRKDAKTRTREEERELWERGQKAQADLDNGTDEGADEQEESQHWFSR